MSLLMKVGTYTGDGSGSNRAITGIGFQPKVVIVTGPSSGSRIRIDSMPANNSKVFDQPNSFVTTGIRSLDSDGFTVSTNGTQSTSLNFSAIVYHYIAFGGDSTDIATGTYLGNGSDNRSVVTGLSFQPDWVTVTRADDYVAQRTSAISSGTDLTWYVGPFSAIANAIQSIASDGFTVGTDGSANSNGVNFYWFAIKGAAGKIEFGSYTGDGSSSRSITGVTTFEPDAVIVTPRDSQYSVWRSDLMASNNSLTAAQNKAVLTNGIGSFLSTGFDVLSASANVNQNTLTYYFIALRNVSTVIEINILDDIGLRDNLTRGIGKTYQDGIALNDSVSMFKIFLQQLLDGIGLADSVTRGLTRTLNDGIALAEVIIKGISKTYTDAMGLLDSVQITAIKLIIASEILKLRERLNKTSFIRLLESIGLTNLFKKSGWNPREKPTDDIWTPRTKPTDDTWTPRTKPTDDNWTPRDKPTI